MNLKGITILLTSFCAASFVSAQKVNDTTTPLHLMKPEYPVKYGVPERKEVETKLIKIYNYLESSTPAKLVDKTSGNEITDYSKVNENSIIQVGDFRLNSYEWGVTYVGMLLASKQTNDLKYVAYAINRLNFLSKALNAFNNFEKKNPEANYALLRSVHPHALDDCGAICTAMLKASIAGKINSLDEVIRNYINFISEKQFRLSDGTLARNRPQQNTLWLDDMFMGIPALAWMGKYSGETKYFDEAARQVRLFAKRMFVPEKGLFMHGWVQEMDPHPAFFWGRANGWAILTLVEVLDALPSDHPAYPEIMSLMKAHLKGLAGLQSSSGFWHQLLDRNDTYLETSATAIYTYCFAHAVNNGWVDPRAYGPVALLGWNAVATKITDEGFVQGTCVGTGMGFDPAYYSYRPVNVYAAHGYGPALLAGAEIIELIKKHYPKMNDSAVQFYDKAIETEAPIFEVK